MSADGSWSSTSGRKKILDPEKHFIIGVDLGTTNSAVSYVDLQADSKKKYRIKIFKVPQLTEEEKSKYEKLRTNYKPAPVQ